MPCNNGCDCERIMPTPPLGGRDVPRKRRGRGTGRWIGLSDATIMGDRNTAAAAAADAAASPPSSFGAIQPSRLAALLARDAVRARSAAACRACASAACAASSSSSACSGCITHAMLASVCTSPLASWYCIRRRSSERPNGCAAHSPPRNSDGTGLSSDAGFHHRPSSPLLAAFAASSRSSAATPPSASPASRGGGRGGSCCIRCDDETPDRFALAWACPLLLPPPLRSSSPSLEPASPSRSAELSLSAGDLTLPSVTRPDIIASRSHVAATSSRVSSRAAAALPRQTEGSISTAEVRSVGPTRSTTPTPAAPSLPATTACTAAATCSVAPGSTSAGRPRPRAAGGGTAPGPSE
mmetsp:Transcript_7387/g.26388  ORF Transcript_7387/g.26388 Transcript_7387/m.26388 type:complete len:354 (-) Transcript_7387:2137-3198(-)